MKTEKVNLTKLEMVTKAVNDEIEKRTGKRTLETASHLFEDGWCRYTGKNPDFSFVIEPSCNYEALTKFIIKNYVKGD